MRPTAARLVTIRLIPKTKDGASALQLPPVSQSPTSKGVVSGANSVTNRLMEAKARSGLKGEAGSGIEVVKAEGGTEGKAWPGNLRVEKAEKKTLFWKIARTERIQLKKLLRES